MNRQRAALVAGFIFVGFLSLLSLAVFDARPAQAQFADQATYATASGGTANAQTVTIPNATAYTDLVGVLIKYVPTVANTSAATLTVNGFSGSPPAFRKASGSGVTALVGGEIQIGQPLLAMYDGTFFNLMAPVTLPIGAAAYQTSALNFGVPVNLQLNATVATNALTIAVKGNNGSDPSATNPVLIPFRDNTIANGGPKNVSLQSALSFTIASGSTMGCVSGQMCRIWVIAICSTGLECTNSAGSDVVGLCGFNALSGLNVAPINEAAPQTSASGTSGGNSTQTYYCNITAVTSRAIRILGYVEIQEATAGTWATGPTYTQLFGPGIKKPGEVVQLQFTSTSTAATTSSATFAAMSGGLTLNITPTSAANVVEAEIAGAIQAGVSGSFVQIQIARGSTLIGVPSTSFIAPAIGTWSGQAYVKAMDVPNATTAQTYQAYGKTTSGALTFPATSNGSPIVTGETILLKEIMSSLEPANDNLAFAKVG